MIENRMLIDSEWGEIEYGVPIPRREFDPWEGEDMDSEWDDMEDEYYGE